MGPYRVGTTTWHVVDESRREPFGDAKAPRDIEVVAWYPTEARGGAAAPYLRDSLAEVRTFALLFKADGAFDALADVKTHAIVNAVPRAAGSKFPLLIFSHGYTSAPSAHTALLEDLASYGYAVLSVVHPYEATAATLSSGRVVTMLDQQGAFLPEIQAVFDEWKLEDETMLAVTKAPDAAQQRALLRGYISKIPKTDEVLRRWVDDEKAVLNDLPRKRSTPTTRDMLIARLDFDRIGVAGHSMGGVTAGQFCVEDRRCKAGLNLDGIPQYGSMIDARMPAPFLMVYSARDGRLGASDAIYRNSASKYTRVDVAGTKHLDFTDMVFWGGPLRARPILGTIAPERVTDITRTVVREFFDRELLGRQSPLLSGKTTRSEVTIR